MTYSPAVPAGPTWQNTPEPATWRLPGKDRLGRWATAGIALSLVLHLIAFLTLNHLKFNLALDPPMEMRTERVKLNPVETTPLDMPDMTPAETVVTPPKDTAKLLDDIEVLDKLPRNLEMEMRADVKELAVNLKTGGTPAASGDPSGSTTEPIKAPDLKLDLPEIGRSDLMPAPAPGQVTIDRGSLKGDELDTSVVDDLLKKGAGGKTPQGTLEGSLEEALGLPANVLVGKTTVLPGDLLFEYNSSELRQSARVGLLKLGTLIDMNPGLYCWIEGYTDLIGGDEFNYSLSQRRAEAVKEYLVKSLRLDPKRILTRGFGKQMPRVTGGTKEEQAPNRRVEIKMRKTLPPDAPQVSHAPVEMPPAPPRPEATPPKAILVKPARALPVEELQPPPPPRAQPVPDKPLRAQPVEETPPPRATVPRAEPVEE
ncbi:hypothetical protein llg_15400 [Luteolibacter sp. LG18]|nr:hypothetical protein llg_15400 [Luteolibacter sp. LG18]